MEGEVLKRTTPKIGDEFYRYDEVNYASLDVYGEYTSPSIPNPKVELTTYNIWKETPKGYWIGFGRLVPKCLKSYGRWVSKTGKKRFAYPTKEEALISFIKRNERKKEILKYQLDSCNSALNRAKLMLEQKRF